MLLGKFPNLVSIRHRRRFQISEDGRETHAKSHSKCLSTVDIYKMLVLLSGWEEKAWSHGSEDVLKVAISPHYLNPSLLAKLSAYHQGSEAVDSIYSPPFPVLSSEFPDLLELPKLPEKEFGKALTRCLPKRQ